MAIRRDQAVQGLLSLFDQPSYLEVGVSKGVTFHSVIAPRKVAVDPDFKFDLKVAKDTHPNAEYHEVTSDEYFGSIIGPDDKFHVIYLDGLHTSEQTLRDLFNAIFYLDENGVILIDDVRPPTHLASIPDRNTFRQVRRYTGSQQKSWMGDVYRCIYFLDTFMQQMEHRTILENHGQTVVWRKRRSRVDERTIRDVGEKSFENLVNEQQIFRLASFQKILDEIKLGMGV